MTNVPTTSTASPSASPSRIPPSWIEELFRRFAGLYGAKWLNLWVGIPMSQVQESWAEALRGCSGEDIRRALERVTTSHTFPPTAPEFAALCRDLRVPAGPSLPSPVSREPIPPEALAKIRELTARWRRYPKATQ